MCVCVLSLFFVDFIRCPTRSTLFPYTTLFRSQYESEVVYHQINEELERQGVIFMDTDTALKEHPELFEEDRKSTRLNSSHVASSYAVFCLKKKSTSEDSVVDLLEHLDTRL